MKQHITLEQLLTLEDEQMTKLREWWRPQESDMVYIQNSSSHLYDEKNLDGLQYTHRLLPLLSIGQMIEILEEYIRQYCYDFEIGLYRNMADRDLWYVYWFEDGKGELLYRAEELCDALWEAVKAIL